MPTNMGRNTMNLRNMHKKILYIDTEVVGQKENLADFKPNVYKAIQNQLAKMDGYCEILKTNFNPKSSFNVFESSAIAENEFWKDKAGLTDYTKLICISACHWNGSHWVKESFNPSKDDLQDFVYILKNYGHSILCGHNIKYDARKIAQEFIAQNIEVPALIKKVFKSKPWEINAPGASIFDTANLSYLLFGTTRSLDDLCIYFDIPTSKDLVVNGARMHRYYYSDEYDWKKVAEYCEADCIVTAKIFYQLVKLL